MGGLLVGFSVMLAGVLVGDALELEAQSLRGDLLSDEDVRAWKAHPDHVAAQARGREAFFESYRMTVAGSVLREYGFSLE